MTDISVQSTAFQVENRSWLLGPHGTEPGANPSITLDVSGFTAGTHYPNGFIPSGTPLAVTAGGLYIPYVDSTTEAGTLTRTSTGGDVRLVINGQITGEIAASAAAFTAATTQAAIRALGAAYAAVTVTGSDGGPLTVTFTGLSNDQVVEVDNDDATGGTIVYAQVTAGGGETPAGEGTCKGLLFSTTKVPNIADTAVDVGAALLVHGFVKLSKLPFTLDAAGQADLKLIHFVA